MTDRELLEAYTVDRSEDAFRELVGRHADMIYSATMRQLGNAHAAQEATQAAFIALASNAARLKRQAVVAGWLHRAAHFAAKNLRRSEARRRHWEEQAATMKTLDENVFNDEALAEVDGALAELADQDRDAIVLRFLKAKSFRELAESVGISEDAAKKRVSRALDKLRGLMERRGIALSAAALATGLSQLPVLAAPNSLPLTITALAMNTVVSNLTLTELVRAFFMSLHGKVALGAAVTGGVLVAILWPARADAQAVNVNANATAAIQQERPAMRINLSRIYVNDQDKAQRFYTEVLGFVKKQPWEAGKIKGVTVASAADPNGAELLLESNANPAAKRFQNAVFDRGIPATTFAVGNLRKEFERLQKAGVDFTMGPTQAGPTLLAAFNDTCGNLIQIHEVVGTGTAKETPIQIDVTSVLVPNQDDALKFYTETLGFQKMLEIPLGSAKWLTVVSPDEPDGTQLLLEPEGIPAAIAYKTDMFAQGIPVVSFGVKDVEKEYQRLTKKGVVFQSTPKKTGAVSTAVFDDTYGNLVQIFQR